MTRVFNLVAQPVDRTRGYRLSGIARYCTRPPFALSRPREGVGTGVAAQAALWRVSHKPKVSLRWYHQSRLNETLRYSRKGCFDTMVFCTFPAE